MAATCSLICLLVCSSLVWVLVLRQVSSVAAITLKTSSRAISKCPFSIEPTRVSGPALNRSHVLRNLKTCSRCSRALSLGRRWGPQRSTSSQPWKACLGVAQNLTGSLRKRSHS